MKKSLHSGFTLFEMMIYIALSILSITLLSIVFSNVYVRLLSGVTYTNQSLQLHTALECIASDVACCSSVLKCDNTMVLLEKSITKVTHIGWQCKKNTLMRIIGVYGKEEERWMHKISQPMAMEIASMSAAYSANAPYITLLVEASNGRVSKRILERKIGIEL